MHLIDAFSYYSPKCLQCRRTYFKESELLQDLIPEIRMV